MRSDCSPESLHERFERLVLQRDSDPVVSEENRRRIADKFAKKSLQELNDIACNLPSFERY